MADTFDRTAAALMDAWSRERKVDLAAGDERALKERIAVALRETRIDGEKAGLTRGGEMMVEHARGFMAALVPFLERYATHQKRCFISPCSCGFTQAKAKVDAALKTMTGK